MRLLITALLLAFTLAVQAQATPAHSEILALLARLEASGCQFNRNGSWYSGAQAKDHLLRKLDYLEKRDAAKTTEQFIELGASGSSTSGKAYQVRCGKDAAVESKAWLSKELTALRAAAAK